MITLSVAQVRRAAFRQTEIGKFNAADLENSSGKVKPSYSIVADLRDECPPWPPPRP